MDVPSVIEDWAKALLTAWQTQTPKPAYSREDVSVDEAFQVQKRYVALRDEHISGYKAALTNEAAQASQGVDRPVAGVLFDSVSVKPGVSMNMTDLITPVIETEVGFVIGEAITEPLDLETFASKLSHWLPMIELGDVGFAARPLVTDIIAGNAAAAYYLRSDYKWDVATANDAAIRLYRDGELLHEGDPRDSMGDQLVAAKWLVDHCLQQGYEVLPGQVLMTGSLGQIQMASPGHYLADYGDFGQVEFDFVDFVKGE